MIIKIKTFSGKKQFAGQKTICLFNLLLAMVIRQSKVSMYNIYLIVYNHICYG
jgi:hypothetical protein